MKCGQVILATDGIRHLFGSSSSCFAGQCTTTDENKKFWKELVRLLTLHYLAIQQSYNYPTCTGQVGGLMNETSDNTEWGGGGGHRKFIGSPV
jgi:hypothetical protein